MTEPKRRRRRGMRLDEKAVAKLPFKRKAYTVWDLTVENCGVRVSLASKACVISVRVGEKKKFQTIGTIGPDRPYEYLRELAIKEIAHLKSGRLPRAGASKGPTLRQVFQDYCAFNPELRERTAARYEKRLARDLALLMDQPVERLTREELLRLNRERLDALAKKDSSHKPPHGFYNWQGTLRTLRAILNWQAAQDNRVSPWPDRLALRIRTPAARELPVELESVEGRRRLIEGLKAINSKAARACMFISYTGFRRGEGTRLKRTDVRTDNVVEFKSKTRTLRVPLSRQALALLDTESEASMLGVTEFALRKPLTRIFGERPSTHGKRACVTPHDLRRYFKSVGTELGIDPTIMNLLVGHTVKGVDKHYIAKLRLSVLRAAAQRIADEIDNPQESAADEDAVSAQLTSAPTPKVTVEHFEGYLNSDVETKTRRYAHYLTREDLHRLVWTAPVTEIAERLGVSDVGLARACRRAQIPVPSRGYWAKVEAGQPICQDPLSPTPPGLPQLIRIMGTHPPPSALRKTALRVGRRCGKGVDLEAFALASRSTG